MEIKNIFWNIKEKVEKVQKWFDDNTNFMMILEYIKSAKKIWVIWHDKIDGDSLWSTLAVSQWLKNKFKDKDIISYTNRKPSRVFDFLNYDINFWEDLKIDEDIDLLIICDSANLERLWDLYINNKEKIENTDIINIDHHISNKEFWKINIVRWWWPATACVVYDILSTLDWNISNLLNQTKSWFDEKVATYLLVWILTDTQNFTVPSADENTLIIASNLIKKWADKNHIVKNIFQSKKVEELQLEWIVLSRIKKIEKWDIVSYYSYYTEEDFTNLWLDVEDSWLWRWLVSILNQIDDADFVSLWKISKDWNSVSFRSKEFDVNKLAWKFGWWWHKNAAWAKIDEKLDINDIENKILEAI